MPSALRVQLHGQRVMRHTVDLHIASFLGGLNVLPAGVLPSSLCSSLASSYPGRLTPRPPIPLALPSALTPIILRRLHLLSILPPLLADNCGNVMDLLSLPPFKLP